MYPSLKYPKLTLLLTIVFGIISALVDKSKNWKEYNFFISEVLFCLAGVALHFTIRLIFINFQKLEKNIAYKFILDDDNYKEWFQIEISKIFDNVFGFCFALLIALVVTYITFKTYTAIEGIDKLLFLVYSFCFFFQVGCTAFIYFMLVLFIWKVQHLVIKSSSLDFYNDEAQNISDGYLTFLSFGIILYFFALAIIWFSPGKIFIDTLMSVSIPDTQSQPQFQKMNNLFRFFVFCIALGAILFFILTQNFIHNILIKFKRKRITILTQDYIKAYHQWNDDKTKENAETIDKLLNWIDYTNKEKEWTINLRTIGLFMGSILTPLIKEIVIFFK